LVGNPYLSSIDFQQFASDNEAVIKPYYKIFNGETIQTFSDGGTISPFQSFLVEAIGGVNNGVEKELKFDLSEISTAASFNLRASQSSSNRLEIVAVNDAYSISTLIFNREDGSTVFGNKDSRKLLLGVTDIPEIYTVKDYNSDKIGVDINVVNTNNIQIPLALATSYEGEMSFTFNGMDSYQAQITLIDRLENREIPLTGSSYTYTFNFTPKKVNNEFAADEERFAIQFSPNNPTALQKTDAQMSVYSKEHTIYAVSTPSDPIKAIAVYNTQGLLVYENARVNASLYSFTPKSNYSEVYIVKLTTERGVKNVKLLNK
jgi:hypothetical protein